VRLASLKSLPARVFHRHTPRAACLLASSVSRSIARNSASRR
jgi:hypothetical protein